MDLRMADILLKHNKVLHRKCKPRPVEVRFKRAIDYEKLAILAVSGK
jgi:hypothetical protein